MMKERPIIFSGPMVRALVEGRKTQTRRVLKVPDSWAFEGFNIHGQWLFYPEGNIHNAKDDARMEAMYDKWDGLMQPKYQVSDMLWVRESLRRDNKNCWRYRADDTVIAMAKTDPRVSEMIGWAHHKEGDFCSPIHMPRWASRITLEVEAVRIERLQEITDEDALAEGVYKHESWGGGHHYRAHAESDLCGVWAALAFAKLWNSIHGPGAWEKNPWVVVIGFEAIKDNVDAILVRKAG